jgi:hypothetical protein
MKTDFVMGRNSLTRSTLSHSHESFTSISFNAIITNYIFD